MIHVNLNALTLISGLVAMLFEKVHTLYVVFLSFGVWASDKHFFYLTVFVSI